MSSEKREFARIYKQAAISYSLLPSHKAQRKITADLSAGGLRFISDFFLPLHSSVKLEINLPQAQKPINAIAEVMWIKSVFGDERYEVGVKFLQIDNDAAELIRKYLENV